MKKNIAIILAGGTGNRMGTETPKQFLMIGDRMVIEKAVDAFEQNERIDEVAIVSHPDYTALMLDIIARNAWKKTRTVLTGGKERYDSSLAAVRHYAGVDCNLLFHDAARPMVSQRIITDVTEALLTDKAVSVAIPATDTIYQTTVDGYIQTIPDRSLLRHAQTPQAFDIEVIAEAYRAGLQDVDFRVTDDCSVVVRYLPDVKIRLVQGDTTNIKITYKEDMGKL